MRLSHFNLIVILLCSLHFSGCGLLVGNVKPVEEKADNYGVLDLSKENPEWKKLEPTAMAATGDGTQPSEISDVAFQSIQTASVISLNSACRPSYEISKQSLYDFTQLLLMGIGNISQKTENERILQDVPALETTLKGKLNGEWMMLRAVVLKKRDCVYDLMYISRPDHFLKNESDFERFVSSLNIK